MIEDGGNVYEWVCKIFDDVEQMMEMVSSVKCVLCGLLKISISFGLGCKVVLLLLLCFVSEYLELKIQLELVDWQIDLVNEGIDFDIWVGVGYELYLFFKCILFSQCVLCVSLVYLKKYGVFVDLVVLCQYQCLVICECN